MAEGSFDTSQPSPCESANEELLVAADGEKLSPLGCGDLSEIGDAEANEDGGVDTYNDPDVAVDAMEADLLVLAGPWRGVTSDDAEADDDDASPSSAPQDARTLFSTLTVSSRNISESWSRYPGHPLDTRMHCVHSGWRLSHWRLRSQ